MNKVGNPESGTMTKEQQALFASLAPLIDEYIKEAKVPGTVEGYVKELTIIPIKINNELNGFWGVTTRTLADRKIGTIKACYIRKQFRGNHFREVVSDLTRLFTKNGITVVEIWAYPAVQKWIERRFKIKPYIYVNCCPIDVFQRLID